MCTGGGFTYDLMHRYPWNFLPPRLAYFTNPNHPPFLASAFAPFTLPIPHLPSQHSVLIHNAFSTPLHPITPAHTACQQQPQEAAAPKPLPIHIHTSIQTHTPTLFTHNPNTLGSFATPPLSYHPSTNPTWLPSPLPPRPPLRRQ
jgi:hypothetical protein